jgi:hypothetical protein
LLSAVLLSQTAAILVHISTIFALSEEITGPSLAFLKLHFVRSLFFFFFFFLFDSFFVLTLCVSVFSPRSAGSALRFQLRLTPSHPPLQFHLLLLRRPHHHPQHPVTCLQHSTSLLREIC